MSVIVALDIGTTSGKGGLIVDGRLIKVVEHRHPPMQPGQEPGWVEQDPNHWWDTAVLCLRALNADTSAGAAGIDAAGSGADPARSPDAARFPDAVVVTGQMQNLILIDKAGEPVCDAVLYSDVRAQDEHRAIESELGQDWADAVGFGPDPSSLPGKCRWMRSHRRQQAAQATAVLFGAHSYVVHRLCGVAAVDPTTAATTGLLAHRDQQWWAPAAEHVGWPLPTLVSPAEPIGKVTAAAAEATGLLPGTPVVHGPGDAGAATVGAIGQRVGLPYVYVGTSGWAAELVDSHAPRPQSIVLPAAKQGLWLRAAPLPAAGAVVEWACRVLLGQTNIGELDDLIGDSCAAAKRLAFVPTLGASRAGGDQTSGDGGSGELLAGGALLGAGWATSPSLIAAAVVEGVAHALRRSVAAASGTDSGPLVATGGALRLRSLGQAIADVTGRTVDGTGGVHGTLVGAAATLLGSAVNYGDGLAGENSPAGPRRWEPRPERNAAHDELDAMLQSIGLS